MGIKRRLLHLFSTRFISCSAITEGRGGGHRDRCIPQNLGWNKCFFTESGIVHPPSALYAPPLQQTLPTRKQFLHYLVKTLSRFWFINNFKIVESLKKTTFLNAHKIHSLTILKQKTIFKSLSIPVFLGNPVYQIPPGSLILITVVGNISLIAQK